jgi:hypothetical protein
MDAHLHLGLIHVVFDFAALHFAGFVDGHLLKRSARGAVREPVANEKVLASGRRRNERGEDEQPAPEDFEKTVHRNILSLRSCSIGGVLRGDGG